MIDDKKLRDTLQGHIDHAGNIVSDCGVAGGHIEAARAEVARELLALLDAQPALTALERIPPGIRAGIDRYAKEGIRPGSCLYAILAGDLFGAFARADVETAIAMPAIVAYIASEVFARGDEAIVERWIARPRS